MRRMFLWGGIAVAAGSMWLVGASVWVAHSTAAGTYSDVNAIPAGGVALVLGCSPFVGRYRNPYFENRIAAAVRLFRAGKVQHLIVSGDNHTRGYDEPEGMRQALVAAGVAMDRIYVDDAGFRTLDSVVRAREVFGQTSLIVVSQRFHNERAIFIARHYGIDSVGFNAADVDARTGFTTNCREVLARAIVLVDLFVVHRGPKFLGGRIDIGTGDQSHA